MDLDARKYNFIQELCNIDRESIMDSLERVLKQEKEEHQEISSTNRKILDQRIQKYKNNQNDLLDWDDVKNDW